MFVHQISNRAHTKRPRKRAVGCKRRQKLHAVWVALAKNPPWTHTKPEQVTEYGYIDVCNARMHVNVCKKKRKTAKSADVSLYVSPSHGVREVDPRATQRCSGCVIHIAEPKHTWFAHVRGGGGGSETCAALPQGSSTEWVHDSG